MGSTLSRRLQTTGFTQSSTDHCLFIKNNSKAYTTLLVYVDDLLITGNDEGEIKSIKEYLHKAFTVKDLRKAQYFLGSEITHRENGMYVNQRKYTLDILTDAGLIGCKPVSTPLPRDLKLRANQGELLPDPNRFRRLIGRLQYLNFTRPDIIYSV